MELREQRMPRPIERIWEPSPEAYGPRSSRTPFRYSAFVPDPIRELETRLTDSVVAEMEAAAVGVRELQSSPTFRGLEAVGRQLLRTEALASSRIEGLEMSQRRIAKALATDEDRDETARSVVANISAMELAVRIASEARVLTLDDVLSIHDRLMVLPRERRFAGRLRDVQNWIGQEDSPRNAEFIPPPEGRVPELMADLVGYLNRDGLSPIAQAAIAHAQFETIHPFVDGNGRTGRALIHIALRRGRVANRIVPPVSVVLATNRRRYVEGLTAYREGDLNAWILFFARSLSDAASASKRLGISLNEIEARWLESVRPRRGSGAASLIGSLAAHPMLTVNTARETIGGTFQSANMAIGRLEAAGILRPVRGDWRRNRLWECPEILALLDEFEAQSALPTRAAEPPRPAPRPPGGSALRRQ
jgi:Fic family protein